MPNAKDIIAEENNNLLVIADAGDGKTHFMGTCPKPYIFDLDNGMKTLRGLDIEYGTFFDAEPGIKANPKLGRYEFGTAWIELQKQMNVIGKQLDEGTCPFETLCFDSLTTLATLCMNYVLKNAGRALPEQRDWGSFLNLMKAFVGTITTWPIQCVLSAHIKRDENTVTGVVEKLPLISGQFSGMVPIYFDEVYFVDKKGGKFTVITQSTPQIRMAKSRLGIPSGTAFNHAAIMAAIGTASKAPTPASKDPAVAAVTGSIFT